MRQMLRLLLLNAQSKRLAIPLDSCIAFRGGGGNKRFGPVLRTAIGTPLLQDEWLPWRFYLKD